MAAGVVAAGLLEPGTGDDGGVVEAQVVAVTTADMMGQQAAAEAAARQARPTMPMQDAMSANEAVRTAEMVAFSTRTP